MAEVRQPGNFILEIANRGQEATFLLLLLFPSTLAKDIAAHISLSITILTAAGNAVNENAYYFKDKFQPKFQCIIAKFAKKFEEIRAACENTNSWQKPSVTDKVELLPKGSLRMNSTILRELTPSKQTQLYCGKREIGELLKCLRELEIGTVVTFSLAETSKPVNILQIADAARARENESTYSNNASRMTVAGTAVNGSREETNVRAPNKNE
ncbi:hypothetical protein BJ878DRAFT_579278 [Calycina marina]|uniref:Uncharacterized protein n=1 Tax=Calycina marina TaxID=1763456 RepID=A0A9P7YUT0_9HELO|nr:hypothetical protein BJ878DRAFT_579278 [Calycina marina]